MKIRGHQFQIYLRNIYDSKSTNVELADHSAFWRATLMGCEDISADGLTPESAFDALRIEAQKFCDGILKNFAEIPQ
jgi:hypothetical protein